MKAIGDWWRLQRELFPCITGSIMGNWWVAALCGALGFLTGTVIR